MGFKSGARPMILTSGPDQFVVPNARLKLTDGTPVDDFTTSQAVIDYLKAHPDREFLLETLAVGNRIEDRVLLQRGVQRGDIFCGHVRFDSQSAQIICN